MRHNNKRSRKRPRAASSIEAPAVAASTSQQPRDTRAHTESEERTSVPRAIPGFVWDSEKRRYFPATSRAANGREKKQKQRQQEVLEKIVAAQKRSQHEQPLESVPLLLRRRSAYLSSTETSSTVRHGSNRDRLLFAGLTRSSCPIASADMHSVVTALETFSDESSQRYMVAGYRSGLLKLMELDSDDNVGRSLSLTAAGEIISIHHVDQDKFFYASMGDGQSEGALTLASWNSSTGEILERYNICAFAACRPPAMFPLRTAVGIHCGLSVIDMDLGATKQIFSMRTKSDILSTTFIDNERVGLGGGRDGHIRLFDIRVDSARHNMRKGLLASYGCMHSSAIHGMGSDSWRLASASMDGQVRVWDLRMVGGGQGPSATCVNDLASSSGLPPACRLGFDLGHGVVAAAGSDSQLRVWSLYSGRLLRKLPLLPSQGTCMALSLEGNNIGPPSVYLGQSDLVTSFRCHRSSIHEDA
ncbi:WD40 repeat-like protein [Coemansia reversa NRRL 1564]|uniref:WD40 repeat-like protein n=1 Tax=Coemansia reversa (strain ATCC 12441 / NRRL 1564) TaxID=763665 RepID=A0A2G5BFV3_COERN|nr:WD40 repeat-like protein [Coemansia reversa NRRL 1564]|eukprot:PIA17895.1 WD40 repeat-like protein [Coemansia reversa NRRL 1564]